MKQLFVITTFLCNILQTNGQGIQFERSLNWKQILEKAKSENKYIFVDFFATWCGPCKDMDKSVYPDEKVGRYFNDQFIAVKVQVDTTGQDNEWVKYWYADAHNMLKDYGITALPGFLFFSPGGSIVHKGMGFKERGEFIKLAANAVDPGRQYYTLLAAYQQERKDYAVMPYLANTGRELGEEATAAGIAQDYIANYLFSLQEKELYTKENLEFIAAFTRSSTDKGFDVLFHHCARVDSVMQQKNCFQGLSDFIITTEEIDPRLKPNGISALKDPDWDKFAASITRKYNRDYAERNVLNAQIRWSESKQDWEALARYNIKKIDKYGLVDTVGLAGIILNNMIFGVFFQHSHNKEALNKAIKWMDVLLQHNPAYTSYIDTYANLLYKSGRRQQGIIWQAKAVALEKKNANVEKREPEKSYEETLEKMRRGEPTWAAK